MAKDAATKTTPAIAAVKRAGISEPVRRAFAERGVRAVLRLARSLTTNALGDAAGAPSDDAALARALACSETLDVLSRDDPAAEARLRGIEARRQLLEAEGGPLSAREAAERLGLTRQMVDRRRGQGRLLAVSTGKRGYLYPSWQFSDRAADGLLPGLAGVLRALAHHDPWTKLAFLVNGNLRLDGASPVAALRAGRVEEVVRAAKAYGEHGSA